MCCYIPNVSSFAFLYIYIVFSSRTNSQFLARREHLFQIYYFETQIPIMLSLCVVKADL